MFQISYDLISQVDYHTQSVSVSTFDFGLRLLAHRSNYEILLLPNVWYELIIIVASKAKRPYKNDQKFLNNLIPDHCKLS